MNQKYTSLRWVLLAAGIVAILGLTGMNIYSFYALRDSAIESERENKRLQVSEFSDKIRHRFFKPFYGLGSMDMDHIQNTLKTHNRFPQEVIDVLETASKDSIFNGIYFFPPDSRACLEDNSILRFDNQEQKFTQHQKHSEIICDGVGIASTRMKALIDDYRYNNKVIFDTHRSMTIALVNLTNRSVIGYLTMPINQDYMINEYLQPQLEEKFSRASNPGIVVWLRDWTTNRIIANSDPEVAYDSDRVQITQRFPDFFDDWHLAVEFTNTPTVATSDASLIKNMIVLGIACFFLLGSLLFMFVTAQREQALAKRQAGFLANVTHELKTPLAVMQAAGENLADGRVEDRTRLKTYGNHIYSEAVRLRRMIDKLLDVAKADAHESLLEPKPVQLGDLLDDYLHDHRSFIENKGFTLQTTIPDSMPLTMVDVESFETILTNLIENAIKYSNDEKFIGISLSHHNRNILLAIEDRGVGIPEKSIKHIFEKFYRAEDALTAHTKGHGLGLSIVKNLVAQNGGSIQVDSEEGTGTTFFVTFPVFTEPDTQSEETSSVFQTSKLLSDSPDYVG